MGKPVKQGTIDLRTIYDYIEHLEELQKTDPMNHKVYQQSINSCKRMISEIRFSTMYGSHPLVISQ